MEPVAVAGHLLVFFATCGGFYLGWGLATLCLESRNQPSSLETRV